jgi:hypothetical protein
VYEISTVTVWWACCAHDGGVSEQEQDVRLDILYFRCLVLVFDYSLVFDAKNGYRCVEKSKFLNVLVDN